MRAITAPYPDNPRSQWVVGMRAVPAYGADKLLHMEYAVWASQSSKDAGDLPFLINSHKAMVREQHQRIRTNLAGEALHISGIAVPPADVEEFLRSDPRAFRWTRAWRDDRGRELLGFKFPSYWGVAEELDPQWQREQIIVPQSQQIAELLANYLRGVEARRLSGDRRGTTIDLQVGASADDCDVRNSVIALIYECPWWCSSTVTAGWGARWLNVTIPNAATIDVANMKWQGSGTDNNNPNRTATVYGDDEANCATFSTFADWDARPRTTASAAYALPATQVYQQEYTTSSLVAPVQEIVNQAGWVSGNALALLQNQEASVVSGQRFGYSYDYASLRAPKFYCEYSVGVARRVFVVA